MPVYNVHQLVTVGHPEVITYLGYQRGYLIYQMGAPGQKKTWVARPADGVHPWTDNVSHGELLREGVDESMPLDPSNVRFVLQGMLNEHKSGKRYGNYSWRVGILTPTNPDP